MPSEIRPSEQKHSEQKLSEAAEKALALIEPAVLDAGGYLVQASESGVRPEVWVKADASLVMSLDLECQRRILARLGSAYPVVAEEDESSHSLIHHYSDYFLVDPLDGTTSCKRYLGERGGQLGYGPLVGLVLNGKLTAASFFSVPHRKLFSAYRGEGTYVTDIQASQLKVEGARRRLKPPPCAKLVEAGILFFLGTNGESSIMQHLKNENAIENLYRFGGFANDCARLAQGLEQGNVQFSVKPWDFSAVLLTAEAGLDVIIDPLGGRSALDEWKIEMNNPLISIHPGIREEFFRIIDRRK